MLTLSTASQQAINSPEVTTYNLFELYYEPPAFDSSNTYEIGSIVSHSGLVYSALIGNPSPAIAPDAVNGADYWYTEQYPLCLTDWNEQVVYDEKIYSPAAIKLGKMSVNGDGRLSDVPLSVGIGHGDMTAMKLVEDYDLVGKSIVIYTFIEGATERPSVTFKIKSAKPKIGQIDLSLSLGFGYFNTQIPGRTIYQHFCRHIFRGSRCKYSGADTTCPHTFQHCKDVKNNIINFGGFPGIVKNYFFF